MSEMLRELLFLTKRESADHELHAFTRNKADKRASVIHNTMVLHSRKENNYNAEISSSLTNCQPRYVQPRVSNQNCD